MEDYLIDDMSSEYDINSEDIKRFLAVRAPMDPLHHLKSLSKQLPPSEDSIMQSKDYVDKIRVQSLSAL
jgi:hypothetical protein